MVRKSMHEQFSIVLVDEFQDTNWPQSELLKNLSHPGAHIAVVGDDDQSIYKFRGASDAAFQFFLDFFPEAQVVELNETYRLPPAVVQAATSVVQQNKNRFRPQKTLVAKSSSLDKVGVYQFPDYEEEAFYVAKEIEQKLSEGTNPSEIGILVRAHSHADLFTEEASRRNLPLETTSPESTFDHPVVKDVFAFLRLLQHPNDSISLGRLLDSPFLGLSADEIFELLSWKPLNIQNLEKISSSHLSEPLKAKLTDFLTSYKSLLSSATRDACSEVLLKLYEKTDLIKTLMSEDEAGLRTLSKFHRLIFEWESVQPQKELSSIFPLLESFYEKGVGFEVESEASRDSSTIKVLTAHASKGLEFDHVYILSLVGRRFPGNFRKNVWDLPESLSYDPPMTKERHLEEERRLLYVAMTRAKRKLVLSTIKKKGTKPSVFVENDILKFTEQEFLELREFSPLSDKSTFQRFKAKPFERRANSQKPAASSEGGLQLSFTQLDQYETCPLKYRFSYDLRIPVPTTPALMTGSAVHEALERFYRDIQNDKSVSKETLLQYFEQAYERESEEHQTGRESDKTLAKKHLEKYFELHEGTFEKPEAVEKPFQIKVGDHILRGKIDRADKTPRGYRIIDYKTGKPKSDENKSDQKYAKESLQFSVYALAAKEGLHWPVDELVFYYLYENTSLSTTRSEAELEITKEKIKDLAKKIQEREFEATPGHHCQWCEYRRLCPATSF